MSELLAALAIVPARGGSKNLPRKNLRLLDGHPLIAYSIAAALAARRVARVVVSTDDEEIAAVARAYGADVPFLRPSHLAEDDTPDLPVFEHALTWLKDHEGYAPSVLVQIRPTSPLRPPGLVDEGIEILESRPSADSARAVVPSGQSPFKMWRPAQDGRIVPLLETGMHEPYNMPRQKLPPTFWQTGHLDVIRARTILEKRSMTGDYVLPIPVDPSYAVDIDSQADLDRAEAILREGRIDLTKPGDDRLGLAIPGGSSPQGQA